MTAVERFDIGSSGFERRGYVAWVGEMDDVSDSLSCRHRHPTPQDALRCATELREQMWAEHQERMAIIAARPRPPMIVNTGDFELDGVPSHEPPSMTRFHQDIDEAAMREAVGRE